MSTTYEEAQEAFLQKFVDTWASTGFRYTFENETGFSTPENAPWARFTIRHNVANQETQGQSGNRKFNRSGSCFVQIFTPLDEGTKRSKALTAVVVAGFEGDRIIGSTIRFLDVIPRETGPEGEWYQVVVEIVFQYTEIK